MVELNLFLVEWEDSLKAQEMPKSVNPPIMVVIVRIATLDNFEFLLFIICYFETD